MIRGNSLGLAVIALPLVFGGVASTQNDRGKAQHCRHHGRRVWRRMSFSTCSAGALPGPDFCFIFAPYGYDEPETLPS